MKDEVNNPPHYTVAKGFEVIDVIEGYELPYHLGNVIKYVLRHAYKGKPLQDLKKAQWYLNRYIQELDRGYVELGRGDRVGGITEASRRIQHEYYGFDSREPIAQCANPGCRGVITSGDAHIIGRTGKAFCSYVCRTVLEGE